MRHSLLIVDDEEFVRNALVRALRSEDMFEIRTADGPKAGWDAMVAQPADIILSDYKMPRMSGLDFLRRIREEYPDTIRIMLTGHADVETVIDAVNSSEVYRFLTKPWADEELKLVLRLAASHLDSMRENRRLAALVEKQAALLRQIETFHPGATRIARTASGAVVIDEEELSSLGVDGLEPMRAAVR